PEDATAHRDRAQTARTSRHTLATLRPRLRARADGVDRSSRVRRGARPAERRRHPAIAVLTRSSRISLGPHGAGIGPTHREEKPVMIDPIRELKIRAELL